MPGSLDARYTFGRFNPAAGVTFSPSSSLNVYAGYSEGSRAPTSIELGCADPDLPCKLPNAMAGDPPLDQVVTRTVEAGFRGDTSPNAKTSWTVGFFTAENVNDILFVSSTQSGFGYFKNFGNTRRRGVELSLSTRTNRVSYGAGYTYLDATYESAETVGGSGNSSNDTAAAGRKGLEGVIEIEPGDRIPLVPAHTLKAFAEIQATSRLTVNFDLDRGVEHVRARKREQPAPAGRHVLSGARDVRCLRRRQPRRALSADETVRADRSGQQPLRPSLQQRSPARADGFHRHGQLHRPPPAAHRRRVPLVNATFYAPGSPTTAWIGLRFRI